MIQALVAAGDGSHAASAPARGADDGGGAGVEEEIQVGKEGGSSNGDEGEDKKDLYLVLQARQQREKEERDAREREEQAQREEETALQASRRARDSAPAAESDAAGAQALQAMSSAAATGMGIALDLADRSGGARGPGGGAKPRAASPLLGMGGGGEERTRTGQGLVEQHGEGMAGGEPRLGGGAGEDRDSSEEEEEEEEDPYGTVALDVGGMRLV